MRLALLLLLVLGSHPIFATKQTPWQCQISAHVRGYGQHFLYYGQDSWRGQGSIYCEAGNKSYYGPIAVTFNSLYAGFGADQNSSVQLLIDLKTSLSPTNLKVRGIMVDRDAGPGVEWPFLSQRSSGRAYVVSYSPRAAKRSLQTGTLFIRGLGQ